MTNQKQEATEIDEKSLEQAVGGAILSTTNKAIKFNPDQGKMAEQDNGYVPDFPEQPKYR